MSSGRSRWRSTACLRFLGVLGSKPGTQSLLKILMRAVFVDGGRSPSGVGFEGGDVVVADRDFLGFDLSQSWRSSERGARPQAFTAVLRLGANEVLSVGTVSLSSWKVSSLHSRSGSPFGWVQALRKREKAPHSPYFC